MKKVIFIEDKYHKIWVRIIHKDYDLFIKEVKRWLPKWEAPELESAVMGRTVYTGSGHCIIFLRKRDLWVVVHELLHLLVYVLNRRGYVLSSDSEEAYAYWLQYFFEEYIRLSK